MGPMSKKKDKVTAGWPIPPEVKESFVEFCAEKGNLAQEDCAGALVIWQYLPAQIREWARVEAKGRPAVDPAFWDDFRRGLELGLRARLSNPPEMPVKDDAD